MFLVTVSASVANHLVKIMRDFLWFNNGTGSVFHWVYWKDVCCSKQDGGLGIRPLRHMNEALKTKWLWCFAKEEKALWRKAIIAKCGVDILGWWTKRSLFAHGLGLWKSVLAGLERFKSLAHFKVKNGSRVRFWHDVWCRNQPVDSIPDLFRMTLLKDAMVQGVVS